MEITIFPRDRRPGSLVFFILLLCLTYPGCDIRKPIKVGFSGQLTGPHANMGVSGRDGVLLAVKDINSRGGIAGRKVELRVCDDKGTVEGARSAGRKLVRDGVVAVIGHMTSSQTMAALPELEKSGMVLLSPTTSTPKLTNRIDNFFRVIGDSASEARLLARHILETGAIKRIAAIYDMDNSAYTGSYLEAFDDEIQKHGGRMVSVIGYSSTDTPYFGPLVSRMKNAGSQGLLIISSALDGALIVQQTRLIGWQAPIFGCGWTLSEPLIENGGKAVERMSFVSDYDFNSRADAFRRFQQDYRNRFKKPPNFMAGNAYEAMMILAAALEITGGRAGKLPQTLPGIRIEGLMQTISINEYGDGVRNYYLISVRNGQFKTFGMLK